MSEYGLQIQPLQLTPEQEKELMEKVAMNAVVTAMDMGGNALVSWEKTDG